MTGKCEPAHRDNRPNHGRECKPGEVRRRHPCRRHERGANQGRRHPLPARGPIRPSERLAAQELLDDLRMSFNARHRGRQRGGDDVREQRRRRADEHNRAAKIAEVRPWGESLPRRDRAPGVRSRKIDPDVSRRVRRDRQVAVADRQHAVHFSKGGFAAGVRRLDDIGRRALRDAQRLHGETRVQGAIHIEDERHPSHDPVGVRPPIEEAHSGRMLRELGHRRQKPRPRRQELCRVVAGGDESRLDGAAGAIRQLGDEAPEDDGRVIHRPRKGCIGSVVGRGRGVGAVLFREQEIEHNRRGPGAFQRLDKRGEALARPRPLPEPLEQFVVDRDDADGLVERIRSRLPALVLVEDHILHHGAHGRADNSSEQRQRASGRRGQCVKSGLVRPSHSVLAARQVVKIEETPVLSSR